MIRVSKTSHSCHLPCAAVVLAVLGCVACGGGSSTVASPAAPPTITMAYGATSVALNGTTSLTFAVSNPNTSLSLSGIGFTDTLPGGQEVGTPNGLSGTCGGGIVTASAGSDSVTLSGAVLVASTYCTFAINVTGTSSGTQNNVTSAVTSNQAATAVRPRPPSSLPGRVSNHRSLRKLLRSAGKDTTFLTN